MGVRKEEKTMENQQMIELIRQELPGIMQRHPDMRRWVLQLTREQYADKQETESRFDRLLDELRRDREENARKWDVQVRRWEEQDRKWEEQSRRWEDQNRKWEDQNSKWEDQNSKWEDQNRKWEDQNSKWEANQKIIHDMLAAIQAQARKHDSSIGALGARWGLYSEQAFRDGLRGILAESFGVDVLNVTDYDETGEVFGHPDQVELDVVIQDGVLILFEIKSSVSKSEMYIFERKAAFYEKYHGRKAKRKLVISPMVDEQAQQVAQKLGIEVYTHADDLKSMKG
jgi:hypothetical protein